MTKHLLSLSRDQQGTAAVEFAIISPLLILLFFGAVELSNLLIADSKLRNVAASVADLLTQKANGEISVADLNIANIATREIMRPLPISVSGSPRVAILISDYRPTSTSAANVIWTRIIYGGGASPTQATQLGLTVPACADTNLPTSLLPKTATSPFNDVLKVTARYEWHPWFATIFTTTYRLESTNYNMPRYSLKLDPASDMTPPC